MHGNSNANIAKADDNEVLKKEVEIGFTHLYAFDFRSARSKADELRATYPNNPWPLFLELNYHWWQIISGNNTPEHQAKFKEVGEKAIALLPKKKGEAYTNDELFLLINISACNSRLLAFNDKRLKALLSLTTAVSYLKLSFGRESNYEAFYLSSGLYNFYILNGHKKHPYLAPYLMLFPRGEEEKSMKYIQKAAESEQMIVNTEAHYFLMKLHLESEENVTEAERYSKILTEKHQANLVFRYYAFKILIEQDKFEEAKMELAKLSKSSKANRSLSSVQKAHFMNLAKEDLKNYYRRNIN